MHKFDHPTRNKWENKYIDAKMKNSHRRSRNKLPRRSSNSLKQELRNGKFNLPLFNRLYTNRANKHYSLDKYLKSDNIYDDYYMILNDCYNDDEDYNNYYDYKFCCNDAEIANISWQCSRCTYMNTEGFSHCKICEQSHHEFDYDTNSITSSTISSSLSSYISNPKTSNNRKKIKIKRKKILKKSDNNSFKFGDEKFKKYKKYMKKRKTSIIAHKKAANDNKWNAAKIEKRKNNANKLYQMYHTVYLSKNKNKNEIKGIIDKMTSFIPKKSLKIVLPETNTNTVCKVCYCDTQNDDELELVSMNTYCSHSMICQFCFIQYLKITISDDENILPWLLCPEQDCKAPIHIDLLLKYISIDNLYIFAKSFIGKHLSRSTFWISCPDTNNKQCQFGWIYINENKNVKQEYEQLKCEGCGCHHTLKEERINDDGFDALISSGLLRECPECNYPAMKDYGMCNVMHCAKCGIYWNWRTKETGTSTNEVKQKARSNGTLWEPGELAYQQDLERNNLPQFIALLARNGIKYDPNYRRGS